MLCNILIKLFMGVDNLPEVARPVIDQAKTVAEHFESFDPSEIPELPKEFIAEPFYSTMLSDLVESPLFVRDQLPKVQELLAPPPLACKATDTSIPHSDEDTAL